MEWLFFQIGKVIRRIASFLGFSLLYFNKMGLKSINGRLTFDFDGYQKVKLEAKDLFLFFDGLVDKETLVGKNILDSPHFGLIYAIANEEILENCEYIIRAKEGRLDMRDSTFYKSAFYKKSFEKNLIDFESNRVTPLVVFALEGKYFLLDGKHRAAFFAFKGLPIEAYIIPQLDDQTFVTDVFKKLSDSKSKSFSKNIEILENALKSNKF